MPTHALLRPLPTAVLALALLALPGCEREPPPAAGPEAAAPERGEGASREPYGKEMAREHAGDAPEASRATLPPPAVPVSTGRVVYAEITTQEVRGYLARPMAYDPGEDEPLPGILVIHEWWGVNDNIRAMARRLAGEGYQALAVDLYQGDVAEDSEEARELVERAGTREQALESNLRQAYEYLAEELGAPQVGVIGWCFGGHWSLRTALLLPDEIDAIVVYYGRLVEDRERLATLDMPILGIFGAEDGSIPPDAVRRFESTLEELGKDAEIHIYDDAGHAFANPSGRRYEPEAAHDAWERTLGFFEAHLKAPPDA